jgi:hypothetical protein
MDEDQIERYNDDRHRRQMDNADNMQQDLMRTFDTFYEQESETMISTLEESREELKNSMLELCLEQDRYKEELARVSEGKYEFRRKKGRPKLPFKQICSSLAEFTLIIFMQK